MSGKGVLGWLILAVALAVPAFMFWNWWKLLNNKPVEFSRKPAAGPVFDGTKAAQNIPNPLASSTAAAAGQVAGSTAAAAGQPARPPEGSTPGTAFAAQNPPANPPAGATPAPAATPNPGQAAAQSPAPPAAQGGAPAASTGTLVAAVPPAARPAESVLKYQPKIHRDPMLSPMDVKRLAQIELEKEDERRRLEEAERKRHEKPKPKVKYVAPIESRVQLYGITAAPGSITAIVEVDGGESTIVRAGDVLPGRVKILKITQTTVTFGYKGKQFRKSLSQ